MVSPHSFRLFDLVYQRLSLSYVIVSDRRAHTPFARTWSACLCEHTSLNCMRSHPQSHLFESGSQEDNKNETYTIALVRTMLHPNAVFAVAGSYFNFFYERILSFELSEGGERERKGGGARPPELRLPS